MTDPKALEVLEFWKNAGPSTWWKKNPEFDEAIRVNFGDLLEKAANRELDSWRHDAQSCLALVLVLDQFSRNLFRNDKRAFAQDEYALEIAKFGVDHGYDEVIDREIAGFFYMPFMHSEMLQDQEACLELIALKGDKGSIKSAIEHKDIIERFGRFPHRNKVLGRQTSEAEQTFLDDGGFAG